MLADLVQPRFYRQADDRSSGSGGVHTAIEYSIDDLLRKAVEFGASDVRLKAMSAPRFTINSANVFCSEKGLPSANEVLTPQEAKTLIYDMLSKDDIIRLENTGDVDLSYAVRLDTGNLQNFRVNVFKDRQGVGTVIRVLEPVAPDLKELFRHDQAIIPIFEQLLTKPEGLVLVTGPTGSGKSTTIAAMLQHRLDVSGGSLITLEQPVEFFFQERNAGTSVIQREVGRDTESFESGLRAALREAPNLLLVGEMRDKESVEGALQAAQTGHLVVATLHTNSAKDTLFRIINAVGSQNKDHVQTQLSQCLLGIVSQQLLRRAKPKLDGPMYAQSRVAVPEVLLLSSAISNQIRQGKIEQVDNSIQTSGATGMRTRDQSLNNYVKAGLITEVEADKFRHAKQTS